MKGHILIVADGRSPTALSWIENIRSLGYQVSLISSFPCEKPEGIAHFHILPIAFSRFSAGSGTYKNTLSTNGIKKLVKRFAPLLQNFRYLLGPLSLLRFAPPYRRLVKELSPDLVHSLRIPFEGMLGSYTPRDVPYLVAIWGNDLTLHARGSWLMHRFTQRCLSRANGLTSDTRRDIRLAKEWGLDPSSPILCVPGSGGLDLEAINHAGDFINTFGIPPGTTWVVNPRGLRPGSIHQEVFFKAIPEILSKKPNIRFICPNLKGQPQAEAWVDQFNTKTQTFLLPKLPQSQLWALFKRSALFISPSSHDGTPNTLLEAMACGCIPIVGDIESLREWIDHNKNGLLINPHDPHALAQAVLTALEKPEFLQQAKEINKEIIQNRAVKKETLPKLEIFYQQFIG